MTPPASATPPRDGRPRRPGCAAGSGSPTGARSAASWRQNATGRFSSACCTRDRTGSSSSPPARDATARSRSTPVPAPTTSCPAAAPGTKDGSSPCSRSRPRTPTEARSCSSHPPCARSRAATSTPSPTPERCGSTSISPDSCTPVGVPRRQAVPPLGRERRRGSARLLAARPSRCPPREEDRPSGWTASRSSARTCGSSTASASTDGRPNVADPHVEIAAG